MHTSPSDILVVTTNHELVRLLGDLLAPDGCDVVASPTVTGIRRLGIARAAALVVDKPPDGEIVALIQEFRAYAVLRRGAPVVFVGDGGPHVDLVRRVGARHLPHPASLLAVVDAVRAGLVAEDPGAEDPGVDGAPPRPGGARSMAVLARWWCRRSSGILCLDGWCDGFAMLAEGGPVGEYGLAAVEAALGGAEIELQPCESDEVGDREHLGRLLWRAAIDATVGESVEALVPGANELTVAAGGLPMPAESLRLLGRLAGLSIGELARREGADPARVGRDFAALRWLGMLVLNERTPTRDLDADLPTKPGRVVVAPADPTLVEAGDRTLLSELVSGGVAAVSAGDWVRAEALLARAAELAPRNATLAAHLGWARCWHPGLPPDERVVAGGELIERALELDPECALAWRYRAALAVARGDAREATRCFHIASRIPQG